MGTAPANFPPETYLEIGQILTGTKLGVTAAFPATVFFTAPTTGLYQTALLFHFVSSDGAGTMSVTTSPPHSQPVTSNVGTPAVNGDASISTRAQWFNAGDSTSLAVSAPGLGATVYNVYYSALRIF